MHIGFRGFGWVVWQGVVHTVMERLVMMQLILHRMEGIMQQIMLFYRYSAVLKDNYYVSLCVRVCRVQGFKQNSCTYPIYKGEKLHRMLHKSCWELHSLERLCVNNVKGLPVGLMTYSLQPLWFIAYSTRLMVIGLIAGTKLAICLLLCNSLAGQSGVV